MRLVGADGLVLGAVVAEDAPNLPKGADEADVSNEDDQPEGALGEVSGQVTAGPMDEARERQGGNEEDEHRETDRHDHADQHRSASDLDVLALGGDRG